MKRLLLAGSAALALSLGASACGSVQPNAAVVNGTAIKARDVEADVTALVELNGASGQKLGVALPAAGVRQILAFEIMAVLFETDPDDPITIDQAALDAAQAELGQQPWQSGRTWASVPSAVRDRLARASAVNQAAAARAGDEAAYNQKVTELAAAAEVTINRRYGAWDVSDPAAPTISAIPPLTTTR